jgi:poly(beta-D-mannuronate) lyase
MSKNLKYYLILMTVSLVLTAIALTATSGIKTTTTGNLGTNKVTHPNKVVPGDKFDLSNWKLTLPIDTKEFDGDPDEIEQPDLDNYSDEYFYYDEKKQAMVFKAIVKGGRTDNTNYTRSELREEAENGDWNTTEGIHSLEIEQAVTHLPINKPHVVVGQIHDKNDDVYVIRLEGKYLYANAENDEGDVVLTENYELGTKFKIKFEVQNDETKIYYNDELKNTLKQKYTDSYFKAGAYVQASCTYTSSDVFAKEDCSDKSKIPFAQVEIYNLKTCHNDICTGKL